MDDMEVAVEEPRFPVLGRRRRGRKAPMGGLESSGRRLGAMFRTCHALSATIKMGASLMESRLPAACVTDRVQRDRERATESE